MGLPATGKPWNNTGIWFLRIVGGKVVEIEGLFDELNLIRQYGGKVVPVVHADTQPIKNIIQEEG